MAKDTRVELVAELEKISPRTLPIETLIVEARAGEFHDYKNDKYTCGKVAAYMMLHDAAMGHPQEQELLKLALQIREGEFDEEPDNDDKMMLGGIISDMMRHRRS